MAEIPGVAAYAITQRTGLLIGGIPVRLSALARSLSIGPLDCWTLTLR